MQPFLVLKTSLISVLIFSFSIHVIKFKFPVFFILPNFDLLRRVVFCEFLSRRKIIKSPGISERRANPPKKRKDRETKSILKVSHSKKAKERKKEREKSCIVEAAKKSELNYKQQTL